MEELNKKEYEELKEYVSKQFKNGKFPYDIEVLLTKQGISLEVAKKVVLEVKNERKKTSNEINKSVLIGVILTFIGGFLIIVQAEGISFIKKYSALIGGLILLGYSVYKKNT